MKRKTGRKRSYAHSVRLLVAGRSSSPTAGTWGLAYGAKPGDFVCVVAGTSVPYLVRRPPFPSTPVKAYELVGECYLHGIMDGEVITRDDNSPLKLLIGKDSYPSDWPSIFRDVPIDEMRWKMRNQFLLNMEKMLLV